MCTVTYIPQGDSKFTLTTNRDENQSRATSAVNVRSIGGEQVHYPIDPVSGGSWIAISDTNRLACVLNGAFTKHQHRPPYERSRGLVLLDFFNYSKHSDFISRYKFEGIEPFTMVICELGKLIELRWDGAKEHVEYLNAEQPNIWSSATLYDKKARVTRSNWFQEWLEENESPGLEDQMNFHRFGGQKDLYNGLVMNRNDKVQTLSITGISSLSSFAWLEHQDLIFNRSAVQKIDFSTNDIVESH